MSLLPIHGIQTTPASPPTHLAKTEWSLKKQLSQKLEWSKVIFDDINWEACHVVMNHLDKQSPGYVKWTCLWLDVHQHRDPLRNVPSFFLGVPPRTKQSHTWSFVPAEPIGETAKCLQGLRKFFQKWDDTQELVLEGFESLFEARLATTMHQGTRQH